MVCFKDDLEACANAWVNKFVINNFHALKVDLFF